MKTTRLKSENATNGKIHIKSIILTRGAAHVDHKTAHDPPPCPYHYLWVAAVARRCQGEANTVGQKSQKARQNKKESIMPISVGRFFTSNFSPSVPCLFRLFRIRPNIKNRLTEPGHTLYNCI